MLELATQRIGGTVANNGVCGGTCQTFNVVAEATMVSCARVYRERCMVTWQLDVMVYVDVTTDQPILVNCNIMDGF